MILLMIQLLKVDQNGIICQNTDWDSFSANFMFFDQMKIKLRDYFSQKEKERERLGRDYDDLANYN